MFVSYIVTITKIRTLFTFVGSTRPSLGQLDPYWVHDPLVTCLRRWVQTVVVTTRFLQSLSVWLLLYSRWWKHAHTTTTYVCPWTGIMRRNRHSHLQKGIHTSIDTCACVCMYVSVSMPVHHCRWTHLHAPIEMDLVRHWLTYHINSRVVVYDWFHSHPFLPQALCEPLWYVCVHW